MENNKTEVSWHPDLNLEQTLANAQSYESASQKHHITYHQLPVTSLLQDPFMFISIGHDHIDSDFPGDRHAQEDLNLGACLVVVVILQTGATLTLHKHKQQQK